MNLNDLKPAEGSKKLAKRAGRGIGSGLVYGDITRNYLWTIT